MRRVENLRQNRLFVNSLIINEITRNHFYWAEIVEAMWVYRWYPGCKLMDRKHHLRSASTVA
jgi:hypothetical protein